MVTSENSALSQLENLTRRIQGPNSLIRICGRVAAVEGYGISARGINGFVTVGDFVRVEAKEQKVLAEVTALRADDIQLQSLENSANIMIDAAVEVVGAFTIAPALEWQGRVVNALAEPIDGKGHLPTGLEKRHLHAQPPGSMERGTVGAPLRTGIKAIDIFTPLCFGQRIGIFAGSGVGKSTLLSMLSRSSQFDTTVVALVGERGREVTEFVSETLGDALTKAVVVVSTSDESAARRKLVPLTATTIAEYFRDQGQNVLLVMDSVTRYAHALRELSMASGEPPVARGYPPSVFGRLPQLMERAGPGPKGSGTITAFYAVLVDGDNHNEPISDAVRGILDGHIVLDRSIAASGRFPAIDVLESISRLAQKSWSPDEAKAALEMRKLISRFEETRDLRSLGGYQAGSDQELDKAVSIVPKLYSALTQSNGEGPCPDAFSSVGRLMRN